MSKIIFKLIGNTQLYVSLFKDMFDTKNKIFAEQFVDCEFIDDSSDGLRVSKRTTFLMNDGVVKKKERTMDKRRENEK